MRLELRDLATLPWPTAAQRAEFVEHVCWAHSWYKHLPFEGARFVVFLRADAGAGFEQRERLHHAWKTTDEYRRRFGLFDYAWQPPGSTTWDRDAGDAIVPSRELLAVAGFVLGPTCSNDGNAIDVICARYADEQPADDGVRVLAELHRRAEDAFAALGEHDREAAFDDEDDPHASPAVRAYRELAALVDAHYAALRAPHVAAIAHAIDCFAAALRA